MANKIRKVIEEVVDEVEGVFVRFRGHVRHDGHDYHAGDTAEIAPEHAAKLVMSDAVEVFPPPAPEPEALDDVPDVVPPPDAE